MGGRTGDDAGAGHYRCVTRRRVSDVTVVAQRVMFRACTQSVKESLNNPNMYR
jgi:hypothetical protein